MNTRPAAVADMFYTGNAIELAAQISDFVDAGIDSDVIDAEQSASLKPKALIVPHAGFVYSGATAGQGYALVKKLAKKITKVIVIGPCHRVWVEGLAIPDCQYFETPLGKVEIDPKSLSEIIKFPQVIVSNEAHEHEHSIEVQLPFLQSIIPQFKLIPIVVGSISTSQLVEVIEFLWGDEKTLIVISSDLSHFLDYDSAVRIDRQTSQTIEQLKPDRISQRMACGSSAIKAILTIAQNKNLNVKTISQCNSGDTAGSKDRVVGYGTYAIY